MVDTSLPGLMQRRRRYRYWSAEEKRSICRETRAPGVSVAQVARRHALNANLTFKWLKDRRFAPADVIEAAPVFLPAEIHGNEMPTARMASPAHDAQGRVEIVLATAHRLIVEGPFDADALARLLSVLVQAMIPVPASTRVWLAPSTAAAGNMIPSGLFRAARPPPCHRQLTVR